MPVGDRGSTLTLLPVTMSFSAAVWSTALARWPASSAITNARAVSSRCARIRSPVCGPSRTSAGFDPKKNGELATSVPLTIVNCSDT